MSELREYLQGGRRGYMRRAIDGEAETDKLLRKKRKQEQNKEVMEVGKAKALIADKFVKDFPRYVEERKGEFGRALQRYVAECGEVLRDPTLAGKVPVLRLQEALCKSFVTSTIKIDGKKYNASHLQIASDYYWECVGEIQEKGFTYVPTLQQFARLLNISMQTLKNYMNSPDEEMRETLLMIRDRFVDYYTSRGMSRQISEVMSIFMLKAEYNIRDNDVPQTVINNNHISISNEALDRLKAEEMKILGEKKELIDEV